MPEKHKILHESKTTTTTTQETVKSEASGFKLPNPDAPPPSGQAVAVPPAPPAPTPAAAGQTAALAPAELPLEGAADASPRDMAVGGGIFLVFVLASFFAKNAWANHLVGKRVSPRSANASGGWLFMLGVIAGAVAALGYANSGQYLTPLSLAGFSVFALAALAGLLSTGRR